MSTIFDDMIAEMESNNLALEALLADMPDDENQMDPATEGLFSKPKTLDEMLANVKKTVDKKCKTSKDCEDWLAKVKNEEEKFNSAIKALQEATKKYQSDNDQKALKATCKPILKNLKKTCNILSMKDISADAGNITEEELKKLRDFLVGAKKIINDKAAECKKGDCDHSDNEGAEESANGCESFLAMLQECTPAEEAFEKVKIKTTNIIIKIQTALSNLAEKLEKKYNLKKQQAKEGSKQEKRAAYWEQVFRTWKSKLNFKIGDNEAKIEKYKADLDKMKEGINKDKEAAEKESMTWNTDDFKANSGEEAFIDAEIQSETVAMEAAFTYYDELISEMNTVMESEVGEYTIEDFMTFAMEGIISPDQKQKWNIQGGEISKQMKATIKEAKKAVKSKDYAQAINLYNKALKGYRGLLATAKKIPDKQLGTNVVENGIKYADGSDTYKGLAKSKAIAWCNQQISACQAAIQKIKDKQSKSESKASESAIEEAFTDFESVLESLTEGGTSQESEPPEEDPLAGLDEALSEE